MADGPIQQIAVIGLGTMGCGIAEAALMQGFSVHAVDVSRVETAQGIERIRARIARQAQAGLVPTGLLAIVDRIGVDGDIADVCRRADLVIEAVPEDWVTKAHVLTAISESGPMIIATNTSSFPIEDLANYVTDGGRFLGAHFFNPAEWVPGVEVIPGPATRPEVVEQVLDVLRRLGKVPALVRSSPGFLANRLQLALFVECLRCVEEGLATPEDVDAVVSSTFGFRLPVFGPFAIADMAGLDVYASILHLLEERFGDRFSVAPTLRALVAEGAYGVKTGRGFRQYTSEVTEDWLNRRDSSYKRLLQTLGLDG
jgi:3-hydroxybutyryl-CoA dehydrogenase